MAFRYRKFRVYQEARLLHKEVILMVQKFPREYWYLADQVKRSSLSILLCIAEGSSKQSDKDFNRFVAISLGSTDETIACLEVALDFELISVDQFRELEKKYESLSNQLGSFSKLLKASSK